MEPVNARFSGDVPVVDAVEAASFVGTNATMAVSGFGSVGYPKAVPREIRDAAEDYGLTVISGGSLGAEIDTDLVEAGAIDRRFPYQAQAASRNAINDGRIHFHDRHVSPLADEVAFGQYGTVDVAVVEAVAVGPDWLVPSTALGPTPAYVAAAERLIVEVNEAQPLGLQALHDVYRPSSPPHRDPIPLTDPGGRIGGAKIRFEPEKLAAVVRTEAPDSPYEFRDPTGPDLSIADNLVEFLYAELERNPVLAESVALQFGVGSLGNALMGAFESVDFGDRDVVYFGEVMQDGLLDMLDAGNLEAASAASLALSTEGQERLFDDIDRYKESVVLRPSDISNSPELIRRFGVVAVNSGLEVDVYGHVNSTHLNGSHVVNGIGGSGDFIRNAHLSVVTLQSTAAGGDISRIVPMVPHVDHTEHDVSIVVTEQGVADLRGLDPRERAETLVEHCAHPEYRPDLRAYLDRAAATGGHIPHDLETALSWHADR
ncbi:acetyl-CoA hydrolase/transferase C-terminal domain-containing protein [Haloglomus litoreum]|uniref:acetyl-CoA hydrolase/transferase C-terminal domain-containing protein n=1 Tax=Haloglomus litoreum TaxID=3034026 RepID=UPI0023E837A9|nr:acetyl-CoA hydrolase/transferase C-terminal domain-containing protein [Haloglomus sp. DT116]